MTKKKAKTRALVGGRPSAFTEEVVKKLEEGFCMDFTITEACAYAGISRQAYYDECERKPQFLDRMERAQQVPFALAKKGLFNAMQKEDGHLILKWLERRQRDRYHTKVEQEVKGTIDDLIRQQEATTPKDEAPQS
jgi:predicted DNA-binding protein YlxM (UPF0122 family)